MRNLRLVSLYRVVFALLVIVFSALVAAAQTPAPPVKSVDLSPGCADCQWLIDSVTGTRLMSGGEQELFFVSGTRFTTNSMPLNPPPNALSRGFTVAVQLAPIQFAVESVLSLNDTSGNLLFLLIRANDGRWYVVKERDNPIGTSRPNQTYYISKTWDPVSPCVNPTTTCIKDTIYASFQSNGQIQLDEVALIASSGTGGAADTYDWESGLLNFGYPLSGFNAGGIVSDPTAPLQMWPLGTVAFQQQLPLALGLPPLLGATRYPQAAMQRIAMWSDPSGASIGVLNNKNNSNQGIMLDQNAVNVGLNVQGQLNWINCSSGQFEQPAFDINNNTDTQYWPSQLPTPCNVPSVPKAVTASGSASVLTLSWQAPAFAGTAIPTVTSAIQSYQVTAASNDGAIPSPCTTTSTSCTFQSLTPGAFYRFFVAAQGMGGATATTSPIVGLSPAAVYNSGVGTVGAPSAPQNLLALATPGWATVSWNPPATGSPITGYQLKYYTYESSVQPTPVVVSLPPTSNSYMLSQLADNVEYMVEVAAMNSSGTGAPVYTTFTIPQATGPNGFLWCADQSESCRSGVSYDSVVAYGGGGSFSYNFVAAGGSITCDAAFFNGDPLVGFPKSCFYTAALNMPTPPAGFTFCALQNEVCHFPFGSTLAYGSNGVYGVNADIAGTAYTCGISLNGFSSDPAPGYTKACFYAPGGTSWPVSIAPGVPRGYTFCANDGGTCTFSGVGSVAYGAQTSFYFRPASGSFTCSYTAFADPYSGQSKSCYYHVEPDPPSGYATACAVEGGTCTATAGTMAAYGANGSYYFMAVPSSGSLVCNVATFGGDPAWGNTKGCFISSALPKTPPPGFIKCGSENTSCNFSKDYNTRFTTTVAYGIDGKFTYGTFTNGMSCNISTFVFDPAFGQSKECYMIPLANYPALAGPPFFSFCTAQGTTTTCPFSGPGIIAYGVPGSHNFTYTEFPYTGPNNPTCYTNLGGDPAPGNSTKSCYYIRPTDVASAPTGFTRCAADGDNCLIMPIPLTGPVPAIPVTVAYGTNGVYLYKNIPTTYGSMPACGTALYNNVDPDPSEHKSCFYAPTSTLPVPPDSTYTFCAFNGQNCIVPAGANIAYGDNGSFTYTTGVTGGATSIFTCNSSTFTDPDPAHFFKACFYKTN